MIGSQLPETLKRDPVLEDLGVRKLECLSLAVLGGLYDLVELPDPKGA